MTHQARRLRLRDRRLLKNSGQGGPDHVKQHRLCQRVTPQAPLARPASNRDVRMSAVCTFCADYPRDPIGGPFAWSQGFRQAATTAGFRWASTRSVIPLGLSLVRPRCQRYTPRPLRRSRYACSSKPVRMADSSTPKESENAMSCLHFFSLRCLCFTCAILATTSGYPGDNHCSKNCGDCRPAECPGAADAGHSACKSNLSETTASRLPCANEANVVADAERALAEPRTGADQCYPSLHHCGQHAAAFRRFHCGCADNGCHAALPCWVARCRCAEHVHHTRSPRCCSLDQSGGHRCQACRCSESCACPGEVAANSPDCNLPQAGQRGERCAAGRCAKNSEARCQAGRHGGFECDECRMASGAAQPAGPCSREAEKAEHDKPDVVLGEPAKQILELMDALDPNGDRRIHCPGISVEPAGKEQRDLQARRANMMEILHELDEQDKLAESLPEPLEEVRAEPAVTAVQSVALRRSSTALEHTAAQLEDAQLYDEADLVRHLAKELREQARHAVAGLTGRPRLSAPAH